MELSGPVQQSSSHVIDEQMQKPVVGTILANALFLLVLFPYISFMELPFDTQPYALICSGVICVTLFASKRADIPKPMFSLLIVMLYAFALLPVTSSDLMSGARSAVGYCSIFFLSFAAYHTFNLVKPKLLIAAVWIWSAVAAVQLLVNKTFASVLLPRMSTSEERGVTSLAVEPSYYAIMCIFMLLMNEVFLSQGRYGKRLYFVLSALLIGQILVSYSGTGILYLMFFFVSKIVSGAIAKGYHKNIARVVPMLAIPAIVVIIFRLIPSLAESRAGMLLNGILSSPMLILFADYSTAQRLSHILISFSSVIQSWGLGFGLGTWEEHAYNVMSNAPEFVSYLVSAQDIALNGRIMSGWGSAVFELGLVGFLPLIVFFQVMVCAIKRQTELRGAAVLSFLMIFLAMLMAVPLAFPFFGYCLGLFMFIAYGQEKGNAGGEANGDACKDRQLTELAEV